jgi:hypothetical protein
MKSAKRMLALALTLLPMLAVASPLGSTEKIVAQVPFEFMVSNKVIPAGQCIVQSLPMNATALIIRNTAAKVSTFSMASPDESKSAASGSALVFNKYGDRYFLSGIKLAGSRNIYRMPESKAETELRARNTPATEEVVLASLQ